MPSFTGLGESRAPPHSGHRFTRQRFFIVSFFMALVLIKDDNGAKEREMVREGSLGDDGTK